MNRWVLPFVVALSLGTGAVLAQQGPATFAGTFAKVGGTPKIVASGRATAQVAANASVMAYTVGAADGTFEVSGDITMTSFAAGSFQLVCSYTDESNTARVINIPFWRGNAYVISATAADVWLGSPFTIRAKAGTTVTLATSGTFTTVTYNVDGLLKQVS